MTVLLLHSRTRCGSLPGSDLLPRCVNKSGAIHMGGVGPVALAVRAACPARARAAFQGVRLVSALVVRSMDAPAPLLPVGVDLGC